jgi:hypothetical protein
LLALAAFGPSGTPAAVIEATKLSTTADGATIR